MLDSEVSPESIVLLGATSAAATASTAATRSYDDASLLSETAEIQQLLQNARRAAEAEAVSAAALLPSNRATPARAVAASHGAGASLDSAAAALQRAAADVLRLLQPAESGTGGATANAQLREIAATIGRQLLSAAGQSSSAGPS
jgi:hypothetical protein